MNKIVNGVANDYEFPNLDWVHHDSKTFDEEKFMEDVERKYIEKHTTHIKGYTKEYVDKLNKQIQELTNNWNELKEWLKEQQEFLKETPTFMSEIYFEHKTMNNTYQNILDKMKEIKENNK